ncbi:MAG: insulinase family protein, partial [Myxococcota bacterium]
GPPMPRGRRLVVVDKPERTQPQMLIGHLGPRHGSADSLAFSVAETVFGGMFTSRLMQEIRVARGWSYGAGCSLLRSRGAHWFRINLAPSADVAAEALALVLRMTGDLAERGITGDEFDFAVSYLRGSLPFHLATARQRVRNALQGQIFGLPDDLVDTMPERLAALTVDEVNRACRTWLRPDDALSTVVATASSAARDLTGAGGGTPTIAPFDSY